MRLLFPLLLIFILIISGCSTRGLTSKKQNLKPYKKQEKSSTHYKLEKRNSITITLYDEYLKWKGTPNRYGGNSLEAVDCSALVQSIYRDAFNVRVPRSTRGQMHAGYQVTKSATKEGDIVLFKTGYDTRHSGIYLENGNFIHSSSKKGVTISSLHNPYWKRTYAQTRRVLP